jgi:hypothetical protein
MTAKRIEQSGLEAVKLLRKKKHRQGLPFMINSDILPPDQCYLEYPDGSMKVVEANSRKSDFVVIEDVNPKFAKQLKKKLKLI